LPNYKPEQYSSYKVSQFLTLAGARAILGGARMKALTGAAVDSVGVWRDDLKDLRIALDATTRARLINNLFYFKAQIALAGDTGCRFDEIRQQRYIEFDEKVLLRFKLFDDALETSNYPTEQAEEFVQQDWIPGLPPLVRLHLGYRLNIIGLGVSDAFVTLPTGIPGAFNAWVWQVLGDPMNETSTYGVQLPLLLTPQEPLQNDVYFYENYAVS